LNRINNETQNIMAKSSSKIVLAGLAGLAVGIAAGILIAPGKGSKTRKRLKKKFRKTKELFQQIDFADTINDLKSIFMKNKGDNKENEVPDDNQAQPIP